MDQEKIGKFIAKLRKEQKLTQEQLAEKLGVTAKSVSRWENGRCLPDVSLYKELCSILGITLNDFFSGEKIKEEEFKWDKEHFFELTIAMIIIVGFIIYGFIKDNGIQYIFMIIGFTYGIWENNRKKAYIERNAYKHISKKI